MYFIFKNPNLSPIISKYATLEYVKATMFDMDPSSISKPGGFTGNLFCFDWEVIGDEMGEAVLSFL